MEKDVLSMTCSIDSHVNTHKSILMIVFEDKVVIVGWDRQTGLCKLLFFSSSAYLEHFSVLVAVKRKFILCED